MNMQGGEKPISVLIQTYDTAFQNAAGGVQNRIVRTVSALRMNGCNVDFFDKFHSVVDQYDILHAFMLEVGNLGLMQYAKSHGKKVILSAIVVLDKGSIIDAYWKMRKIPVMTTYKRLFQMCDLADAIITETQKEADFIAKHYHVPKRKIYVIPNGADKIQTDSQLIFETLGTRCPYALEVARFDKNKNQMNVIRGLKNTDTEVVFIGGPDFNDSGYYNECIELAKDAKNIHFLGWLDSDSELLKSAYTNASAVISSSFCETFGLSIVEGAMSGAVPVISKTLPILDYDVFHDCLTFDPADPDDIRRQVEKAMHAETSGSFINSIQSTFSWDSVAKQHVELYRSLCDENAQKNTCNC